MNIDTLSQAITYRGVLDKDKFKGHKRKSRNNINNFIEIGDGLYLNPENGSVYLIRS